MSARLSTILIAILLTFSRPVHAQKNLTVAAAADLSALEPELSKAFCKNEANCQVHFVTEASGVLTQQIENGAPYDVFMSANANFIDRLITTHKVLPDSVVTYAQGHVGILWRDGKPHQLRDLVSDSIRFVALPNPKLAPYGVAAQQVLEHLGIWSQVQPKAVYGENVRQTLQLFDSGNADAVLTAGSLLIGRSADFIPQNWHSPVIQKAAIVAASINPTLGRRFIAFLTGADSQAIFLAYGFGSFKP